MFEYFQSFAKLFSKHDNNDNNDNNNNENIINEYSEAEESQEKITSKENNNFSCSLTESSNETFNYSKQLENSIKRIAKKGAKMMPCNYTSPYPSPPQERKSRSSIKDTKTTSPLERRERDEIIHNASFLMPRLLTESQTNNNDSDKIIDNQINTTKHFKSEYYNRPIRKREFESPVQSLLPTVLKSNLLSSEDGKKRPIKLKSNVYKITEKDLIDSSDDSTYECSDNESELQNYIIHPFYSQLPSNDSYNC